MKKISNLLMMALLTIGMGLTSCEDILGHWEKPIPTPTVDQIIKYGFKVTDLSGTDRTEAVTSLKMSNEDGTLVVEAEVSADHKVAIKAADLAAAGITAAADFWFEAAIDGKPYMARVNIDPATLSPKTDKMLAMATLGDVVLSDGSFAVKGTTGEQAVIAYIGKVYKYFDRFLAIALEDADANKQTWDFAWNKVGQYAAAHSITIGSTTFNTNAITNSYNYDLVYVDENTSSATAMLKKLGWRVPSVTDWRYILAGIGGLESPTPTSPAGVKDGMEYGNGSTLRSAINAACGNTALRSDEYWSSSQRFDWSTCAWAYHFNNSKFYWTYISNSYYVRAVFAY